MKIVSVGLYNPIPINSGSDSYITFLLNSIDKAHSVKHYYLYPSNGKRGHYPKEKNFNSEFLNSRLLQKVNLEKVPKSLKLIRPEFLFENTGVKEINADVVLCDVYTYHVGKTIAKNNNAPIILIMHNVEWKYLKSYGSSLCFLMKPYEYYVQKKVDAITTISFDDYLYVTGYMGQDNIYYIPPNIDTTIFKPEGSSYDYGNDKFNLLFYGSLDRPANIEALKIIKQEMIPSLKKRGLFEKIRINIFGSGVPPKFLNIDNDKDINYLGTVDDPGRYIRGADLKIVPLKHSGGVKIRLLETLFCGKPIITSKEAAVGLPEQLKNFVYVEDSIDGFVDLIAEFLNGKKEVKIPREIIQEYIKNIMTLNDVIRGIY